MNITFQISIIIILQDPYSISKKKQKLLTYFLNVTIQVSFTYSLEIRAIDKWERLNFKTNIHRYIPIQNLLHVFQAQVIVT